MNNSKINQDIETAARLIREAQLAVVFTGAGISTPSGIPDFRGSNNSIWHHDSPMESASLTVFHNQPERFYKWLHPLAVKIFAAEPNAAHTAIARLEKAGFIKAVITQNIDQLHQKAGSESVFELHGSATSAICLKCQTHFNQQEYLPDFLEHGTIPRCSVCNSVLKPDIVLYEELLPARTWENAEEICQRCDLLLVAGSSLEVVPASTLPMIALRNGAHLIIINYSTTQLDDLASLVIHDGVEKTLPAIARILL